jgi:UDP-3-O-[3-hydroxymyristoyl] N-acetylglucosamine deacetylase
MNLSRRRTLRTHFEIEGTGVHSGSRGRVRVNPAAPRTGIVFRPMGAGRSKKKELQATWRNVARTELCTTLGNTDGFSVATVEHLLSALAGLGIDDAIIEVEGPETPILDGSAAVWVDAIDSAGIAFLDAPRRVVRVLRPVRIERGAVHCSLSPAPGFTVDVSIDFAQGPVGRQRKSFALDAGTYRKDIARARTFGNIRELEKLLALGFARGSSLDNTVALDGDRVLNSEGLRYPDEFVRHKALDAVGDLFLAGMPIQGAYVASRPGHAMNVAILSSLFSEPKAFEIVEGDPAASRSYGLGIEATLALA